MKLPWADSVVWDDDFNKMIKEFSQSREIVDGTLLEEFPELFGLKRGEK